MRRARIGVGWQTAATAAGAALVVACGRLTTDADPYLWLEALDSPQVQSWVAAENAKTLAAAPLEDLVDLDALAQAEGRNWVWEGMDCDPVTRSRCLVQLSEGGEDAVTVREFDRSTAKFVPKWFVLDRGKQNVAWVDADTLLVSREWQPGEKTASGYPYVVKRWQRGRPLEQAVEVGHLDAHPDHSLPLGYR